MRPESPSSPLAGLPQTVSTGDPLGCFQYWVTKNSAMGNLCKNLVLHLCKWSWENSLKETPGMEESTCRGLCLPNSTVALTGCGVCDSLQCLRALLTTEHIVQLWNNSRPSRWEMAAELHSFVCPWSETMVRWLLMFKDLCYPSFVCLSLSLRFPSDIFGSSFHSSTESLPGNLWFSLINK
jgi:hypothetical protein